MQGAGLDSGSKDYRNDRKKDHDQNTTILSFQRMQESNFLHCHSRNLLSGIQG